MSTLSQDGDSTIDDRFQTLYDAPREIEAIEWTAARFNATVPEALEMFGLGKRDAKRARMTLMRYAYSAASDSELLAIQAEYQDDWALLQGDLHAGDYPIGYDATMAQIAYIEWHLKTIEHEMVRRMRARVRKPDELSAWQWQNRFDAMRRIDLVWALGTLGVGLHKRGREYKGQCPFHDDRTPSFSVNQDKGLWVCYSCQRGGDLVEFVVLRDGKSRGEALAWLETMLGSIESGTMMMPEGGYEG